MYMCSGILGLPLPVRLHQLALFPEAYSQFPGFPVWLRGEGQYIRLPPEEPGHKDWNPYQPNRCKFMFLF